MKKINGIEWKNALISGANNIENKKNAINALNVFPVPDGDTGSNMAMTISTAKNAISNINDANIANVAKAISTNMLLGARGNSGVILSQIFKGFANGFANKNEITTFDLVEAFVSAAKVAYTAVLKPIEGTILTVIREISEGLKEQVLSNTTIEEAFENIVKLARQSCDKTPELLSILKEVGVTDSGGEGLYAILEGMNAYFHGKPVTQNDGVETIDKFISDSEVYSGEFGYCTEFILEIDKLDKFNKDDLVKKYEKIGNSMVVVQDENFLKVHIHTKRPGNVLTTVNSLGQFVKIKIENMTIQANNSKENSYKLNEQKQNSQNSFAKKVGLISCNTGQGLIELAKEFGVNYVIEGGQTNNPSTQDLVNAIEQVDAKTIFILPNNSNIILSAQQAATIVRNKKVIIIPTKSQAQCLSVAMNFSEENSVDENESQMNKVLKTIKYAEITPSIKDVKLEGIKIKKNDFMCMLNNKLIGVEKTYNQAAKHLVGKMINKNTEIITLIYGQDASEEDANEIKEFIETTYDVEVAIYSGGQAIYPYYICAE